MTALPISPEPPSWARHAACLGCTELFFAPVGERESQRIRREDAALALCESCPVRIPCRDHARLHAESGIWGGETEEDRRAATGLRRARRRNARW